MYYTIYQVKNLINSKIYIGKHQTENLDDGYMGSGKNLKRAIKKYGIENFEKTILFVFETEEEMNNKERVLVTEDFCKRKDTYNICEGGKGGFGYINNHELSIEWKRRNAYTTNKILKEKYGENFKSKFKKDWHKNNKNTDYYNNYLKNLSKGKKEYYKTHKSGFYGKTHTVETKRKIGQVTSVTQSGKNNSQYGTCWITNGKENKKIKKEDLHKWEESGYYKGRKMFKEYTP